MPRRKKAVEPTEFTPDEQALVEKYPAHRFKPGSLTRSGEVPGFGTKRTITILCADCGRERVVATSDVFHVRLCAGCKAAERRVPKAAKE